MLSSSLDAGFCAYLATTLCVAEWAPIILAVGPSRWMYSCIGRLALLVAAVSTHPMHWRMAVLDAASLALGLVHRGEESQLESIRVGIGSTARQSCRKLALASCPSGVDASCTMVIIVWLPRPDIQPVSLVSNLLGSFKCTLICE